MAKKSPVPTVKQLASDIENGNENGNGDGDGNATGSNATSNSGSDTTDNGHDNGAVSRETRSTSGTTDGTVAGNNGSSGTGTESSKSGNGDSDNNASTNNAGTGTGSGSVGSKRGRGRPVGSKNRTGTERTETETRTVNDSTVGRAPRKVKGESVEDEALANVPQTTRELIENVYSGLYWSIGQLTGYPQVWELKEGQEEALAGATEAMIKSLGKRKASKTLKAINEYFPGISLVVTALVITVPRIQATRIINNGKRSSATAPTGNSGNGADGNISTPSGINNVTGNGPSGNAGLRERPVTGADFKEFGEGFYS